MKTLGLIGGMSWESTLLYYRLINEGVKATLGGLHSAPLLIYSFDFAEIATLQKENRWEEAAKRLADAGLSLKSAGAEALLIGTNTMHKVAEDVEEQSGLPLLHIADCTAEAIRNKSLQKVGLLGTEFTMSEAFYRERLKQKFGLDVVTPEEAERKEVHRIIYEELCQGIVQESSKQTYMRIIGKLRERGAEGIILGCTEIGLLISQDDYGDFPVFDTTAIHAAAAVEYMLS